MWLCDVGGVDISLFVFLCGCVRVCVCRDCVVVLLLHVCVTSVFTAVLRWLHVFLCVCVYVCVCGVVCMFRIGVFSVCVYLCGCFGVIVIVLGWLHVCVCFWCVFVKL